MLFSSRFYTLTTTVTFIVISRPNRGILAFTWPDSVLINHYWLRPYKGCWHHMVLCKPLHTSTLVQDVKALMHPAPARVEWRTLHSQNIRDIADSSSYLISFLYWITALLYWRDTRYNESSYRLSLWGDGSVLCTSIVCTVYLYVLIE